MSTSMRVINRARVLFLVRRQPGLTRADLSRLTGLSKATVSNHVAELLEASLLYEDQKGGSRMRNTGLHLNRDAGLALGIELSPDECRGVLSDAGIRPLRKVQRRLCSTGVDETTDLILSVVRELTAGVTGNCLGLFIGVPALTDAVGETLVFSESLGWADVPLARKMSESLGYRVKLVNRVRAGALGEHWLGAGVDVEDLIYVSVSSGIAAGILIGGQLVTGSYNNSGELGHTTAVPDGSACVCGNQGCLETVASVPAITRSVQRRVEAGEPSTLGNLLAQTGRLTNAEVIAAARDGDAVAVDEIRKASRYLGIAIANLIDLFNPAMVVIGGQLAEAGEILFSTVRNTVQHKAFPPSFAGVQVVRSALGPDSVCIGACALVVDQYVRQVEPSLLPFPAAGL
jgi:predicted NBD/HSP70 family sugar kinase